jgi:hypothetical protein
MLRTWSPGLAPSIPRLESLACKHLSSLHDHVRVHLIRAYLHISSPPPPSTFENVPGIYNIKQNQNTGGITTLISLPGAIARYNNHHSAPIPIGYSGKNIVYLSPSASCRYLPPERKLPQPHQPPWRLPMHVQRKIEVPNTISHAPRQHKRSICIRRSRAGGEAEPYHPDLDHARDNLQGCGTDGGLDDS